MNIIWIDDDKWRCEPLCETFKLYGHQVDFFPDCKIGYDKLLSSISKYNVLILDIMMPPGNLFSDINFTNGDKPGFLIYKKIREQNPNFPVLIYTVLRDTSVINKYISNDNPHTLVLNKPASAEDILTSIKKIS